MIYLGNFPAINYEVKIFKKTEMKKIFNKSSKRRVVSQLYFQAMRYCKVNFFLKILFNYFYFNKFILSKKERVPLLHGIPSNNIFNY